MLSSPVKSSVRSDSYCSEGEEEVVMGLSDTSPDSKLKKGRASRDGVKELHLPDWTRKGVSSRAPAAGLAKESKGARMRRLLGLPPKSDSESEEEEQGDKPEGETDDESASDEDVTNLFGKDAAKQQQKKRSASSKKRGHEEGSASGTSRKKRVKSRSLTPPIEIQMTHEEQWMRRRQ